MNSQTKNIQQRQHHGKKKERKIKSTGSHLGTNTRHRKEPKKIKINYRYTVGPPCTSDVHCLPHSSNHPFRWYTGGHLIKTLVQLGGISSI